jgi:hypothetical protein
MTSKRLFDKFWKATSLLFPLWAVLLFSYGVGKSRSHRVQEDITISTQPVYCGEAFEQDIQPSPFILYWGDFRFDTQWWNSFLGAGWYPTCGGCVVYDPIWNPWNKMILSPGFPVSEDSTAVADSVQKTLPLLSTAMLDSVSVVQIDSMPTKKTLRQRWKSWREERKHNKQNNRY